VERLSAEEARYYPNAVVISHANVGIYREAIANYLAGVHRYQNASGVWAEDFQLCAAQLDGPLRHETTFYALFSMDCVRAEPLATANDINLPKRRAQRTHPVVRPPSAARANGASDFPRYCDCERPVRIQAALAGELGSTAAAPGGNQAKTVVGKMARPSLARSLPAATCESAFQWWQK
jgi:hypothetical protein